MSGYPGIPQYDVKTPPGSSEGGDPTLTAHWFGYGRREAGIVHCDIVEYTVAPEMPTIGDYLTCVNYHLADDQPGYGAINASNLRIDLVNDQIVEHISGAGEVTAATKGLTPDKWQFGDVPKLDRPSPPLPLEKGKRLMFVHRYLLDPKNGSVELWLNGAKIVDEHGLPTIYTGLKWVELWVGMYTKGAQNAQKTLHALISAVRHGSGDNAFADARAARPVDDPSIQWGANSHDTTIGVVQPNGRIAVPPSSYRDPDDFAWPADLVTSTAPPVVVPPAATPYTVSQTINGLADLSGIVEWFATPSDIAATAKVEAYVDGVLVMGRAETTAPYGFTNVVGGNSDDAQFDTTKISDGQHTFLIVATATDGRVGRSSAVVNVKNSVTPPASTVDPAAALADCKLALKKLRAGDDYKNRVKVAKTAKAFALTSLDMVEAQLVAAIKALGGSA